MPQGRGSTSSWERAKGTRPVQECSRTFPGPQKVHSTCLQRCLRGATTDWKSSFNSVSNQGRSCLTPLHWISLCKPCERRCSESLSVLNIACAAGASWVVTARQAESLRRSRINFVRAETVLCWISILISECRIAQSQGKSNDLWKV